MQAQAKCTELVVQYESYLSLIDKPKDALLNQFSEEGFHRKMLDDAEDFGDGLFELLKLLGEKRQLYRYIVI